MRNQPLSADLSGAEKRRARLAALLILFALLPTGAVSAQEREEPTWPEVLQVAVEHRRFAVRRAATGKLAKGGDAAVPAVRAFQAERGLDAVPLLVVDALAKPGIGEDDVGALLREWSGERAFFWRSQALRGVAYRATPDDLPRFQAALGDPSHLYRIEGVRGLLTLDPGLANTIDERPTELADQSPSLAMALASLRRETDPRARLRMALLLMQAGSWAGIGDVLAAIDRADARWLDDPWGSREATFAVRELRRLGCGDFRDTLADEPQVRADGRALLYGWALEQGYAHRPEVLLGGAAEIRWTGGLEIRSCRSGDLHLRWTDDGRLATGLLPVADRDVVKLDTATWQRLRTALRSARGASVDGKVICDYLRLLDPQDAAPEARNDRVHRKCAPDAVPAPLAEWLGRLRDLLRDSEGEPARRLGGALAARLPQFAID